jgi:hypothetical protein
MAIYGIAEIVYNLERKQEASVVSGALGRAWPSLADLRVLRRLDSAVAASLVIAISMIAITLVLTSGSGIGL